MHELTLYFKSGNKVTIKCSSYSFQHRNSDCEYVGYKIKGAEPTISFQPSQLEAYSAKQIK